MQNICAITVVGTVFKHFENLTRVPNDTIFRIDHLTVVFLVTWPMNESDAGVDHDVVLVEISLPFLCKFLLIRMTTSH